jgi:hypothetical protein
MISYFRPMGMASELARAHSLSAARIWYLDLDTFFASVERLLDPTLKGEPVVVGAKPGSRVGHGYSPVRGLDFGAAGQPTGSAGISDLACFGASRERGEANCTRGKS